MESAKLLVLALLIGVGSGAFNESTLLYSCKSDPNYLCFGLEDYIAGTSSGLVAIVPDEFGKQNNKLRIRLMGKPWRPGQLKLGFVAVGFSETKMGENTAVVCGSVQNIGNKIYGTYTTAVCENELSRINQLEDTSHIQTNWIDSNDRGVFCDFYVNKLMYLKDIHHSISLKHKPIYYITVAVGPNLAADDTQIERFYDGKRITSKNPTLSPITVNHYEYTRDCS